MKIKYKQMNLFDAPQGSVLVHAVNCQGVWGSGIAAEFKKRFPLSYVDYRNYCEDFKDCSGAAFICQPENDYRVANLFTSDNFSSKVDPKEIILINTVLALGNLSECFFEIQQKFYSNKFNSGLFNVPWEETEAILAYYVNRYNLDWTVCIHE